MLVKILETKFLNASGKFFNLTRALQWAILVLFIAFQHAFLLIAANVTKRCFCESDFDVVYGCTVFGLGKLRKLVVLKTNLIFSINYIFITEKGTKNRSISTKY